MICQAFADCGYVCRCRLLCIFMPALDRSLSDCRYDTSWRVINARGWVPQSRERVYIVGFRSDLAVPPMDWAALDLVADPTAKQREQPAAGSESETETSRTSSRTSESASRTSESPAGGAEPAVAAAAPVQPLGEPAEVADAQVSFRMKTPETKPGWAGWKDTAEVSAEDRRAARMAVLTGMCGSDADTDPQEPAPEPEPAAATACVADVLEAPDSPGVAAAALKPAQWEVVQQACTSYSRWGGKPCEISERTVSLSGISTTLTSSYHNVSNMSTKFIFSERDGSARDIPRCDFVTLKPNLAPLAPFNLSLLL